MYVSKNYEFCILAYTLLWTFVSHQYFSIEITRKLDVKTHKVKIISSDEFSLFILLFTLSGKIADCWYKAYVSVIKGALFYLFFVKSSYIDPIDPEYDPPVQGYLISFFLNLNNLITNGFKINHFIFLFFHLSNLFL